MSKQIKQFTVNRLIDKPPKLIEFDTCSSVEHHYNIPWEILYLKNEDYLFVGVRCLKSDPGSKWEIKVKISCQMVCENDVIGSTHKRSFGNMNDKTFLELWWKLLEWDRFERYYRDNEKVSLEVHVEFLEMIGFEKKKLRYFDESVKDLSDVVLIVENEKFYVSKLFLSFQSPYFKALLMGEFKESNQSEVVLNDLDPEDFQKFLEVLHGELAINDETIEGILQIADMYDCHTVIRFCEKFLLEKSKFNCKEKLQLSSRYNLNELKVNTISQIKSSKDVYAMFQNDFKDLDSTITTELLNKISSESSSSFFHKVSMYLFFIVCFMIFGISSYFAGLK